VVKLPGLVFNSAPGPVYPMASGTATGLASHDRGHLPERLASRRTRLTLKPTVYSSAGRIRTHTRTDGPHSIPLPDENGKLQTARGSSFPSSRGRGSRAGHPGQGDGRNDWDHFAARQASVLHSPGHAAGSILQMSSIADGAPSHTSGSNRHVSGSCITGARALFGYGAGGGGA
jgi:hypothetical protein